MDPKIIYNYREKTMPTYVAEIPISAQIEGRLVLANMEWEPDKLGMYSPDHKPMPIGHVLKEFARKGTRVRITIENVDESQPTKTRMLYP